MKTLATAFKEVYGEALKEYGFKKVKGKYPYYARVIGDEIVHIITYKEEWCAGQNLKAFSILGGVATVYRKKISFDESPKDNAEWLVSNSEVLQKKYYDKETIVPAKCVDEYEYEKTEENSMKKALQDSLELTKKNLITVLNEVVSLKECIKFFVKYRSTLIRVRVNENYIREWSGGKYNEGLLCTKVYGSDGYDEYAKDMKFAFDEYNRTELFLMSTGKSGLTYEEHKTNEIARENRLMELLKYYEVLVEEEEWKKMIEEELEQRKKNNLQVLKNCGLI